MIPGMRCRATLDRMSRLICSVLESYQIPQCCISNYVQYERIPGTLTMGKKIRSSVVRGLSILRSHGCYIGKALD